MTNDVWVTLNKGIPSDVFMSEDTATKNKFHSETVAHFIRVNGTAKGPREEQLEAANAELRGQVEELTRMLEKAEKRMGVIEQLGGVPVLLRRGRAST